MLSGMFYQHFYNVDIPTHISRDILIDIFIDILTDILLTFLFAFSINISIDKEEGRGGEADVLDAECAIDDVAGLPSLVRAARAELSTSWRRPGGQAHSLRAARLYGTAWRPTIEAATAAALGPRSVRYLRPCDSAVRL